MIRLDDVAVDYGGARPALAIPTLRVAAGEFVTIIGSNGAGKSTLLRLISGAVRPSRGRVVIGEREVTALPAHARAPLVAQVFQDPLAGSCGALSIEENFAVAARRAGRRSLRRAVGPALRERARTLLAEAGLGLEQRLSEPVMNLSGGQRQVLALAMALVAPAAVLLLDEHTAALDPKTAEVVLAATERFVQAARPTVLMVTHSMQQALAHGSRTIMLDDGEIALDLDADHRRGLTPADLVALFTARRGQAALTDRMLLSA